MLVFSEVKKTDFGYMLDLYERFLNTGEGIARHLNESANAPGYLGVKCMDGDVIVGVITAEPGVKFTCGHEDIAAEIQARWRGKSIYTGDMLVVLPEYRGRGIARRLSENWRELLRSGGCEILVIEGWHRSREDDVPMSGILKYMGKYTTFGEYPDFYSESERYGVVCPECGANCLCGARICVIEIDQTLQGRMAMSPCMDSH